jgi:lipoprotein NlpI
VLEVAPKMRPYMWQRGLCLYYLGKLQEGAQQFRDDVAVNPNDTEEAIWAFLFEAQLVGPEQARQQFLQVGVKQH